MLNNFSHRTAWRRTSRSLAVLLVWGLALAAGCNRKSSSAGSVGKSGSGAPVPVLVTQVIVKAMPVEVTGFGNVQALSRVTIRSRVAGEVTQVHFQEGQFVRKGDLLFTIDPRPIKAAWQQAQANLARDEAQADNARVDFERHKKLMASALISRDDYDKVESTLKALEAAAMADRAALSNATLNLEFTRITSPIDGRTGNLLVYAGNLVQAGVDAMVSVNQLRPIYVAFSVPEQYLADISRRMNEVKLPVEVFVPGRSGRLSQGVLAFVDNAVDTTTGMIQLKALFGNDDNALWPGQFVQVVLQLKEQPNALVVPAQAIQSGQTNDFVFVVKADQSVEMRPIKMGLTRANETVVEQGLSVGETVVTDGQLRLLPTSMVKVRTGLVPVAPASVQAGPD